MAAAPTRDPTPSGPEEILLAGDMPGPRCRGALRPFGNNRTRTVRGVGADTVTVTPRRARCADCRVTQILLPTELLVRRADSTAAIRNALVAKAGGAGFRSVAARFGQPESGGPPMVRAVREPHAQWLYQRRGQRRPGRPGIAGLAGAAANHPGARAEPARRRGRASAGQLRRQRPAVVTDRILCPRVARGLSGPSSQLRSGSGRALPWPAPPVTTPTKPCTTQAKWPSPRRPGRHRADQEGDVDSRLHLRRRLQPEIQRPCTDGSVDADYQAIQDTRTALSLHGWIHTTPRLSVKGDTPGLTTGNDTTGRLSTEIVLVVGHDRP